MTRSSRHSNMYVNFNEKAFEQQYHMLDVKECHCIVFVQVFPLARDTDTLILTDTTLITKYCRYCLHCKDAIK